MIPYFLAMPEYFHAKGRHIVGLYLTVAWSFHKFSQRIFSLISPGLVTGRLPLPCSRPSKG